MTHTIASNQMAKVGKAPDALARVPEMMDTPPILLSENVSFIFFTNVATKKPKRELRLVVNDHK
jgi:hypothetical protein